MTLEQSQGSANLRRFWTAIDSGRSLSDAVEIAGGGFTIAEGRMHLADKASRPPSITASQTKDIDDMAGKKTTPKVADPLGDLGAALAADHTLEKAKAAAAPAIDPAAIFKAPDPVAKAENAVKASAATESEKPADLSTDEKDAAWDRQLDRVVEAVVNAEFESGTLVGDMVDAMLNAIRHNPKGWAHMDERQQKDTIKNLEKVSQSLLKKVAIVIQEGDSPSLHAKLVDYSAKDGFSIKLSAAKNEEHALLLYQLQGHEVIVTTVDTTAFNGKRKEHPVDKDQPEIPFADEAPKAATKPAKPPKTPPADDSDLAGEVDEKQPTAEPASPPAPDAPVAAGPETGLDPAPDATEANPNATDRLFNAMFSEWLTSDGVTWSDDEGQAGAWEPEKADEIANGLLSAELPRLWVYPVGIYPDEKDAPDFVVTPAEPETTKPADEFEESAEDVAKRNATVTGKNYDDVFPNSD